MKNLHSKSEPSMNPHVADKLFNELTAAEVAYRMKGIPVSEFLKKRANKHLGDTKKHLLRVASLGEGAEIWMNYFIDGMQDEQK